MFVDLDHFKSINDTFGHAAGDDLLRQAAKRLQSVTRAGDTLVRYAGDEFVLVCPDLSGAKEAVAVAERVNVALVTPIRIGDREIAVTGSIGIAVDERHALDGDALLRLADGAMFEAKRRRDRGHPIQLAAVVKSD